MKIIKLTPQQKVLAIAAGIVGARFDIERNQIVAKEDKAGIIGWNADGTFFVDLTAVAQNEKWKFYYSSKVIASYGDATAKVQRIIQTKGVSL